MGQLREHLVDEAHRRCQVVVMDVLGKETADVACVIAVSRDNWQLQDSLPTQATHNQH